MHTKVNCVQDLRKSERGENDLASSGSVADRSAHQTLDGRAPELPRDGVQEALTKFGVPRSLSDRVPFLFVMSGYDPARVRAMARLADGNEWLPYGWAR